MGPEDEDDIVEAVVVAHDDGKGTHYAVQFLFHVRQSQDCKDRSFIFLAILVTQLVWVLTQLSRNPRRAPVCPGAGFLSRQPNVIRDFLLAIEHKTAGKYDYEADHVAGPATRGV
jgi:hypothetical protein